MKYRMTVQTKAALRAAQKLGHATNHAILREVQKTIPDMSATTIHRITTRMIQSGLLCAGPEVKGCKIIDANTIAHDHFVCVECCTIKDIYLDDTIRKHIIELGECHATTSRLTITGSCDACHTAKEGACDDTID